MMVAHTKHAARDLSKLFADRKINKTYLAIVEGEFNTDMLTINEKIDGKSAISHIKLLTFANNRSLLEVRIETGRKHQIRKHLSGINYPIIGDRLYGNADKNHPEDLQLQAIQLEFTCPITQEPIQIELSDKRKIKS
jgi:tRNA pseudouridine32 synthase/23S rRNA pseudouridine746 synthase